MSDAEMIKIMDDAVLDVDAKIENLDMWTIIKQEVSFSFLL